MNADNPSKPVRPTLIRYSSLHSALVLLALLFVPLVATAQQQESSTIRFVKNPDLAPDFQLKSIDDKPVSLAASRGKVTILNFWATWCGPCRAEVPDLVELQSKYKDRLQVVGLVTDDDDEDAVKKFVETYGINYPVAAATNDIRIQYGGIPALPTSFIIDLEGRVVQKHEGLRDPELYETEIRALLGMPINARMETFEDTGEIFLKHADRASTLPGVDLTKLTPDQKTVVLHRFNAESCTCGCKFTLAQCRIYDAACQISQKRTGQIIKELSRQESNRPPRGTGQARTPASLPNPTESSPPLHRDCSRHCRSAFRPTVPWRIRRAAPAQWRGKAAA